MIPSLKSRSTILSAIQEQYPNYHPLLAIAQIAHSTPDVDLQFQCHKVIAKYVEPELRSVEVKADPTTRALLKVSLFEDADVSDAEILETPKLENW